MSFWWLSFCDPIRPRGRQFLGGCIVEAGDMAEAIAEAWRHGCNPGGEAVGHEVPPEFEHNIPRFGVNKLLSKEQVQLLDTQ
jgi:hypothetical protein